MTHEVLLVTSYADGRERSTRHRTIDSAKARVERQNAAGKMVDRAQVYDHGMTVARYSSTRGWTGRE